MASSGPFTSRHLQEGLATHLVDVEQGFDAALAAMRRVLPRVAIATEPVTRGDGASSRTDAQALSPAAQGSAALDRLESAVRDAARKAGRNAVANTGKLPSHQPYSHQVLELANVVGESVEDLPTTNQDIALHVDQVRFALGLDHPFAKGPRGDENRSLLARLQLASERVLSAWELSSTAILGALVVASEDRSRLPTKIDARSLQALGKVGKAAFAHLKDVPIRDQHPDRAAATWHAVAATGMRARPRGLEGGSRSVGR